MEIREQNLNGVIATALKGLNTDVHNALVAFGRRFDDSLTVIRRQVSTRTWRRLGEDGRGIGLPSSAVASIHSTADSTAHWMATSALRNWTGCCSSWNVSQCSLNWPPTKPSTDARQIGRLSALTGELLTARKNYLLYLRAAIQVGFDAHRLDHCLRIKLAQH